MPELVPLVRPLKQRCDSQWAAFPMRASTRCIRLIVLCSFWTVNMGIEKQERERRRNPVHYSDTRGDRSPSAKEPHMLRILPAVLVGALLLTPNRAAAAEPLAGNWKVTILNPDQPQTLWLIQLEQKDG